MRGRAHFQRSTPESFLSSFLLTNSPESAINGRGCSTPIQVTPKRRRGRRDRGSARDAHLAHRVGRTGRHQKRACRLVLTRSREGPAPEERCPRVGHALSAPPLHRLTAALRPRDGHFSRHFARPPRGDAKCPTHRLRRLTAQSDQGARPFLSQSRSGPPPGPPRGLQKPNISGISAGTPQRVRPAHPHRRRIPQRLRFDTSRVPLQLYRCFSLIDFWVILSSWTLDKKFEGGAWPWG